MYRKYLVVGTALVSLCLASWVALAMAQPGPGTVPIVESEPGLPTIPTSPTSPSGVAPSPIPSIPTSVPTTPGLPTTPELPTGPESVPSFPDFPAPGETLPTPESPTAPLTVPSEPIPTVPSPASPTPAPAKPTPATPESPVGFDPTVEVADPVEPGAGTTTPQSLPMIGQPSDPQPEVDTGAASHMTPDNPLGRQEPCVSMEWIGAPTATVGEKVNYSLVVRNTGVAPVQQVLVRVRIPEGLGVDATEPKATVEDTLYSWDLGTLLSKQERVLKLDLQTLARGDSMPQAWVTFTGSSVMRIRVREPKLVLKASAPEKVLVGDAVAFTLSVSNPGDGAADRVKIRAALSEGLEHARGNTVDFEIGNLAAGETRSVQVICAAKGGGVQKCDGYAEATSGLKSNDSATVNVIKPYLDLQLVGPGLRYLERKAIYTLQVTNPGDAPATNVTVSHQVPVGFKVLAASDGGRHDFSTRTVSWFLGQVAPGKTREVKLEVQAINPGVHVHKATAIGARGLRAEAEMKTRVEGLSAIMLEMVDTEDPIEVNAQTAYEIRITNTGSKTEGNIKLVAIIPDEMEFVNAKGPVRYRAEGNMILFEPLPKLAPRADAIFRLNVRAKQPAIVRFEIRVTSMNLIEPVIKMEPTRIYSDAPEAVNPQKQPR